MSARHLISLQRFVPPKWRAGVLFHPVLRSLPFCVGGRRAQYVHRPRKACLLTCDEDFHRDDPSWMVVDCWCGITLMMSKRRVSKFTEHPGDRPICATCEGRAIGAGLLGSREIAGRPVMFSPRPAE